MIPEIGHYALVLALSVAALQAAVPMIGARMGVDSLIMLAKPLARAQFLLIATSFITLIISFVLTDLTVSYVVANSNSTLPLFYRISAVWGAHEGSLLLWVLILSAWTFALTLFDKPLPLKLNADIIGILGIISFGFLLFTLFTSNPFDRVIPPPQSGRDLNPLLQDFGLIVHPPMLYMGYVGFAVPFAFAVAGLLNNQINSAWAKWVRPWTLIAWAFLGLGIALGSWWAYYELGWGGWWFWDPVENASFMPWLLGTALIHSVVVTQKKAIFKHWTVLLAIVTFGLSLVGTFLVRSGVLTSVHAFATDPARGVFILMFLAIVIGGALLVFTFYKPDAAQESHGSVLSRESFLLTNSVLLSVATATVLLGTLYPLMIDALGLGKISVGAPYFNSVFIPLMAPLLVLIGLGQRAFWTSDSFHRLYKVAKYPLLATIILAVGTWGMIDDTSPIMALFGLVLGLWVIFSTLAGQMRHYRSSKKLISPYLGQSISHVGFAITVIGITLVSSYGLEKHLRMSEGEITDFGGYEFRFAAANAVSGPNYNGTEAVFLVHSENKFEARLTPQKRNYHSGGQTMTEAGISPGFTRDIYISLGEKINDTDWSVRLNIKPFVRLIWLGAILMAFGAFIALGFGNAMQIRQQAQKSNQINTTTGISK